MGVADAGREASMITRDEQIRGREKQAMGLGTFGGVYLREGKTEASCKSQARETHKPKEQKSKSFFFSCLVYWAKEWSRRADAG
jgi:hypothetical protein